MKFRSDYVTNSSSSSFIFKSTDLTPNIIFQFRSNFEHNLSDDLEPYSELDAKLSKDYEDSVRESFNHILSNIKSIEKFSNHELSEVVNWYSYDIIRGMIKGSRLEGECFGDQSDIDLSKLSDDALHIILDILFLNFYFDDPTYTDIKNEDNPITKVYYTIDQLQSILDNHVNIERHRQDIFDRALAANYDRLAKLLPNFANTPISNFFSHLFNGGDFLYFDWDSTHYVIVETFYNDKNCLYACGHMG